MGEWVNKGSDVVFLLATQTRKNVAEVVIEGGEYEGESLKWNQS